MHLKRLAWRQRFITLIALLSTASFLGYAQQGNITVTHKTVSAGTILEAIQTQTGYKIAYARNVMDTEKLVELPAVRVSVAEALEKIAETTRSGYVVQRDYIAFVPAEEQPKPAAPIHRPRTNDRFDPNAVGNGSAAPVLRPVKAAQGSLPVRIAPAEIPAGYSAYNSVDKYGDRSAALPRFAVKANLLYGAVALTPNLALEFGLTPKTTLEISGSYNAFNRDKESLNDTKQLLHRMIRAEYRWWLCERFNGHFFGAHAFYAQYNISGHNIPLLFEKEYRYDGSAIGAGVSYGYNLPLGKRWGLEFNIGIGAAYLDYDRFSCAVCDRDPEAKDKFYFGPTRAGVTLTFHLR